MALTGSREEGETPETGGTPKSAKLGGAEVERILSSAEEEVDRIFETAEADVVKGEEDERNGAMEAIAEQRRRVVDLRSDLVARAAAVSAQFESMFTMLESAERELAARSGGPPPDAAALDAARRQGMQVRLREEREIIFEASGPAVGETVEAKAEPVDEEEQDGGEGRPSRRRWWRRSGGEE